MVVWSEDCLLLDVVVVVDVVDVVVVDFVVGFVFVVVVEMVFESRAQLSRQLHLPLERDIISNCRWCRGTTPHYSCTIAPGRGNRRLSTSRIRDKLD